MEQMDKVKKNFGFGCMRLPMNGDQVDIAETTRMVDEFLAQGFNYFDTAHGYIGGKSELALKECLTSRYPREAYSLTDKLTDSYFKTEADIRPFFESQLEACGVDYFDFYLMHAQNADNFKKFKACRAYETAFALKAEGRIRHVGLSFHDRAEVLDQILTEYPQIEVVQIQFNYLDYDDIAVQSRKCYEVCRKHGKPVLVMEPVKGGSLVNLPEEAKKVLDDLHGGSPASYAIRFAAGFPGMMMVLSGMSNMEQMKDNLSYMRDFKPLNETELAAVNKVQEIFHKMNMIPCTACRYCVEGCPKQISIPDLFAIMNIKQLHHDWNADYYYEEVHTAHGRRASDCLKCGKCEKIYWQKGTPLEALRLYYLTEDGQCSDTPVEINTGKSYVAVTDVDFAGNFVHSKLDGVDLSSATTVTYERSYVEDDAKAGDTLGMSTDDLTNNATGAGEAEVSNTEDTTSGESYTEDTTGSEETTGDTTGGEEHVEPSADGEETPAE